MVTEFVVQWQRDTSFGCSDRNQGSFTENQGFNGLYTNTGLEPGNRYTISVTVFNTAGSGPVSNAVTATTMQTSKRLSEYVNTYPCYLLLFYTDPTGHPRSVRSGTVTASSITVQWGTVPCLDRNGEITGYRAQAVRNGMVEGTASVGGSARQATISGLAPSTTYTIYVAANNTAGYGPFSSGISVMTSGKFGEG